MANTVGVNDDTMSLLKHVAKKAGMPQAEAVRQGLILYAEQLGLVTTRETKIEVVKRTFEIKDEDWTEGSNAKHRN